MCLIVAKKGEVASISSRKQYDYFLKQALSAMPKVDKHHQPIAGGAKRANPLDSRGQAHRAERDKAGRVTTPGGGAADPPPSSQNALQAIMAFHQGGGSRAALPKVSPTRNAARKDLEHAKMRRDRVIRPAVRPPGTAELEKQYRQRNLQNSKKYLSKSISEQFTSSLDEALGL
jgi:hypothetical protein